MEIKHPDPVADRHCGEAEAVSTGSEENRFGNQYCVATRRHKCQVVCWSAYFDTSEDILLVERCDFCCIK